MSYLKTKVTLEIYCEILVHQCDEINANGTSHITEHVIARKKNILTRSTWKDTKIYMAEEATIDRKSVV